MTTENKQADHVGERAGMIPAKAGDWWWLKVRDSRTGSDAEQPVLIYEAGDGRLCAMVQLIAWEVSEIVAEDWLGPCLKAQAASPWVSAGDPPNTAREVLTAAGHIRQVLSFRKGLWLDQDGISYYVEQWMEIPEPLPVKEGGSK